MTRVLSFQNRQRTRPLNLPLLRRITRHVLENELAVPAYELGFQFVEPAKMAQVNQDFLQHEGSTDVITFDYAALGAPVSDPSGSDGLPSGAGSETGAVALHGEAFICVADAVQQAREFGTTWPAEVVRYVIHAVLHLRGYDDLQPAARKIMKREENRLLKRVTGCFPIHALARRRNPKSQILNPQSPFRRGPT